MEPKRIPTPSGSITASGRLDPIGIYCDAWKWGWGGMIDFQWDSNGIQSAAATDTDAAAWCGYSLKI